MPDATLYELQIVRKDEKNAKPLRVKLQAPTWSATVRPGLYKMQLRSFDERGAPGDWSPPSELQVKLPSVVMTEPKPEAVITEKSGSTHSLQLAWEPVPGAAHYKVEIKSTTTDWHADNEVREAKWQVDVPVAQSFSWNVTAIEANGQPGEVNATASGVQVIGPPVTKPEIEKPLNRYVEELHWSASENAKTYNYEVKYYNPVKKKWFLIEHKEGYSSNTIKFKSERPSGLYRLKVQAVGERRQPSRTVQLDVETRGGFRDPAALNREMLRDSITKPTNFYAIASYLVTEIQYQAINREANAVSTFKARGGTGRIGIGYHNPESEWGGFAIVDQSGFIISGQNPKFASIEAHLTHKLELGQSGLILLGAGIFSKELPAIEGSGATFTSVGKMSSIGPHLGFTYWVPFNQRFGVQVNARAYEVMTGHSVNGQAVAPALSYQYGLLGSYRLAPAWMGYAGYAYRLDQANYKSIPKQMDPKSYDKTGGINSIAIEGHYLNFILEFSF